MADRIIEQMFVEPMVADLLEKAAIVALLRQKELGWNRVAVTVEETGSAVSVLQKLQDTEQLNLLDDHAGARLDELKSISREIAAWEREGMHLITVLDSAYPENLRTVHDRPPVLFVRGGLLSGDSRSVAVVSTRQPSPQGLAQADDAAAKFTDAGFTVVSGLAAGVDSAAHRGALKAGGRTLAVIGTGLRKSYPKENAELQQQLCDETAVISQFWPDQPPGRHTFPMRNAVMSGFALATFVIEASYTSGARMQARLALEHGRPVFLQSTLLEHSWAREYAEMPGTYIVESADEVVSHLDRLYAPDVALTT